MRSSGHLYFVYADMIIPCVYYLYEFSEEYLFDHSSLFTGTHATLFVHLSL